ncbi:unnamed protein product [Prorocentrum cordatum]|uniref:Uncharacterized protein n=1 Tax=Prorocentrum cordatum TaxID=2364126 RepID=A0ABN9UAJ8_9DINO|nr:unnamed protein product [Polarella glacialis]
MQQRELAEKMLRNTGREKKDLQEQLVETISGFTDVIDGLQEQCAEGVRTTSSSLGPPDEEGAREQLRELAAQNRRAQAELQSMQQREKLQRERAENAAARQPGVHEQLRQLREERDALRAQLAGAGAPSAPQSAREQSEQALAQELKRFRQDVEGLHHQKESTSSGSCRTGTASGRSFRTASYT